MAREQPSFLLDMAERVIWTFVQAFAATLVLSSQLDMSTLKAAGLAGIAAVLAVIKALAASQIGQKGTAATLPDPAPTVPAEPPPAG